MRAPFAFSLLGSLLILAPETGAAESQRPRPVTISVVAPAGQPETAAQAEEEPVKASPKPASRIRHAPERAAAKVSPGRNTVQFLLPDRSMGTWIEPVQIAADRQPIDVDEPGLRVARRETRGASSVVVLEARRQVDLPSGDRNPTAPTTTLSATQPAPPQAVQGRRNHWNVFAERPQGPEASAPIATARRDELPTPQKRTAPAGKVRLAPAEPPLRGAALPPDRAFSSDPAFLGELPQPAASSTIRF